MKILSIDIETTPNLAHVWGLWDQNIGLNQLLIPTEMLCFAAKWKDSPKMYFGRQEPGGNKEGMIALAHCLLDDADVVMHFNGKRFDERHMNREFAQAGLFPPAPYKRIDLMLAAKKQFAFSSNKLDHMLKSFQLEGKVKHAGHQLWVDCMAWDEKAWRKMATYNKRDVRALEDLYDRIQPWIQPHPNIGLYDENPGEVDKCPTCGSVDLRPQGHRYTSIGKYQRFQCGECGKWSSSGKRVAGVNIREVLS